MKVEDMSTRRLKRYYFKWLKKTWGRQYDYYSTASELGTARGKARAAKAELERRDWFV